MKVVSVPTMQDLDQKTITGGVPDNVLMERAGRAAFEEILAFVERCFAPRHRRRFCIAAGKGNNGGDGYVIARLLREALSAQVDIYSVCDLDDLRGAAAFHARKLPTDVPVHVCSELPCETLSPGTVLIDALLGTGISGPLRPPYDRIISQINSSRLPVISVDVPSGLNGDTGEIATEAVTADLTVTMALPKRGLVTPNGLQACGRLRCVDIGVSDSHVEEAPSDGEALFAADMIQFRRRRPRDSHKYTFGRVAVIGGSRQFAGAPMLTGASALRAGGGLVTVMVPESIRQEVRPAYDALILAGIPDNDSGRFTSASVAAVRHQCENAQAVAFGPGVGRDERTQAALKAVLDTGTPAVVDADGLNLLSNVPSAIRRTTAPVILTPHPGEMRRLMHAFELEDTQDAGRTAQAAQLASATGAWIVLKGMGTVVAAPDGRTTVNTSGGPELASAGTGDVLTGVIAALLAQGFSPWDAATHAVYLHGLAGELQTAARRLLVADDLLDWLGVARKELAPAMQG